MKFALCDDNPNELRQIRDYLLRYDAQANWKGFASSEELLAAFRQDYFDIVLLDIEMEGMNGYQAAEELNKLPVRLASGHRLCAGCAESIIAKQILMGTSDEVAVSLSTGCMEVSTT